MTELAPVPLRRFTDWRTRLSALIAARRGCAPEPGVFDCAVFPADAVAAMTGVDLAEGWRGYATVEEGFERLLEAGFEDHVALAAARLPEVAPALAQVGDVAAIEDDAGRVVVLGVVQGPHVWVVGHDRLGLVPLRRARRAFRVG
jgi:hypothetical protein